MVMTSHSCVLRDFELVVSQQQTAAGFHQGAQILDPTPICHLQPRTTLAPQIGPRLHSLLLYCTLEPAPADPDSTMIDPVDALIGPSVVGPTFALQSEANAVPKACFIFRDLSMRTVEGLYRLRFTLFETVENRTIECGAVISSVFRYYEHGTFPDLTDPNTSSQALHRQTIKPRVNRAPMIRKRYQPQRSSINGAGLPEHPGLASAIYRPEPRSQVRISRVGSGAGSDRTGGTREKRPRASRSNSAAGHIGVRQGISSSLPSLSDRFARQDNEGTPPHHRQTALHVSSPFVQYSLDASRQAVQRAHRPEPSTSGSSSSRLSKKQSAPARLDGNARSTSRPAANPGHQVGAGRRERRSSRERGPVLPALIRRQLSRQSSPASVSMISGAGSPGSRTLPPISALDPFYAERPIPHAHSGLTDPTSWISSASQAGSNAMEEDRPYNEHTTPFISHIQDDHGRGKMGISNLLS